MYANIAAEGLAPHDLDRGPTLQIHELTIEVDAGQVTLRAGLDSGTEHTEHRGNVIVPLCDMPDGTVITFRPNA